MKRSFADVPVDKENDNAISTTEFLEAAESLTGLFGMTYLGVFVSLSNINWNLDVLGSVAFTPVKNDIMGNIKVSPHFP